MTRREVKRKVTKELGLTQEQLAKCLGVTSAFITRYFKGKSTSTAIDKEIARMLKVPFEQMPGRRKAA